MAKKLSFEAKEKMVALSGACFWYWNSYYSFLDTCGVHRELRGRYPREAFNKYDLMRNLLSDLEQAGKTKILNAIASNFYRLSGPVDRDQLDIDKARLLLQEFRALLGNDPIEAEIKRQKQAQQRKRHKFAVNRNRIRSEQLEQLNERFISLHALHDITPQQRGFDLEELFFDLLAFCEFEHKRPFRSSASEQIDGHFRYEKFDYLVEVKWTKKLTKQDALSIFDGKIRGKAQSTRGFFLSASGFDQSAIDKFSGDSPRIILMSGEDLALVVDGQLRFEDAMRDKIDAIVRKGQILLPLRSLLFGIR